MKIIDDRLKTFKLPTCLGRIPRSIYDRNKWNATEWLMWIVFYAPICLKGLLPEKYLRNLGLFINGITIFLSESITPKMIDEADAYFKEFVKNFEELYTEKAMNYNIHLLLHVAKTVRNWGPLYCQNTFPFENENRLLLMNKKSYYKVIEQIVNKKLFFQHVPLLFNQSFMTVETKDFCENIRFGRKLKNFKRSDGNCILIGRGKSFEPGKDDIECLRLKGIQDYKQFTVKSYNRILYNGFRVTSTKYTRAQKTNNSCFEHAEGFAVVRNILLLKNNDMEKVLILASPLKLENNLKFLDIDIQHIWLCKDKLTRLTAFDLREFKKPAVISILENENYVLRVPKGCLASER